MAALMLATVQTSGEVRKPRRNTAGGDGGKRRGLQFWIGDLIDFEICERFAETFGITVREFLNRVRGYRPSDRQLAIAAKKLSKCRFAALGEQQGARPGRRPNPAGQGRFIQ